MGTLHQIQPSATVDHDSDLNRTAPSRAKFDKDFLDSLRAGRSVRLTDERPAQVTPTTRLTIWDTVQKGLCVLVSRPAHSAMATVTFRVAYYVRESGKPRYHKIGRWPEVYPDDDGTLDCGDLKAVRRRASEIRNGATKGVDPKRTKLGDDFASVVYAYLDDKDTRTVGETKRIFEVYVLPEWADHRENLEDAERGKWVGGRKIASIDRSDIHALLTMVARRQIKGQNGRRLGGKVMRDAVLAQLSALFNWYAAGPAPKDFRSPIVKKMRKTKPKDLERSRVLSDTELRIMWPILGEMGVFGAAVKCMVLTAQRVHKVGKMRRRDVKAKALIQGHTGTDGQWIEDEWVDNVWDATREDDPANKGVSVVPLSAMARAIIDEVPVIDCDHPQDWVFSLDGKTAFNGWSKHKARLDNRMLTALRTQTTEAGENPDAVELKPWQLRDLRRTARTLMTRAGVTEVAEHCLGHVMSKIERTYNRYDYLKEKRMAFDKLANLVERIVAPRTDNVVALPQRR